MHCFRSKCFLCTLCYWLGAIVCETGKQSISAQKNNNKTHRFLFRDTKSIKNIVWNKSTFFPWCTARRAWQRGKKLTWIHLHLQIWMTKCILLIGSDKYVLLIVFCYLQIVECQQLLLYRCIDWCVIFSVAPLVDRLFNFVNKWVYVCASTWRMQFLQ